MAMDFGAAIFFTDYSIGPAALGRALEERGFGSLWAPEHSHIPLSRQSPFPAGGDVPKKYYDVMDPFVTLAAAAAATTKLQVATGICLVVQRDPIQTAKAVASLDQVSGGRFLFGIGAGWNAEEMADHGTDFKSRFTVMQERVEAMRAIWTQSKPSYDGAESGEGSYSGARAATSAETSPSTVCSLASTSTRRPRAFAVCDVTGPIEATSGCGSGSSPRRSQRLDTVDDDVKVIASTSPRRTRSSAAGSGAAVTVR